ncbi:hypothetical protein [Algibacter sp. 2305UL17-15]|uniref:type IV toxin-antitoxin system AbiEi family antitoxin domain-containing protein n=1 Tax=Algibacter sp. 2305UL17-15 TaxID=3231268 RepID=UPI00345B0A7D
MKYLDFEKTMKPFTIFSVKDIKKRHPNFDNRRLVEWQQKGYITKIKRGFYYFSEQKINDHFLYFAANKIYAPSYVSLQSALAYYGFIPEGVFTTYSISTRNTTNYDTKVTAFKYKHIKSSLFFGYKLKQTDRYPIKIADAEKAILDFFYMNTLNTKIDIEAMRFNMLQIQEKIDFNVLKQYQRIFNSKTLDKRIALFKNLLNA